MVLENVRTHVNNIENIFISFGLVKKDPIKLKLENNTNTIYI